MYCTQVLYWVDVEKKKNVADQFAVKYRTEKQGGTKKI
jgi:hypothetical protein